jgi:glycine hydroxymethyltransferase
MEKSAVYDYISGKDPKDLSADFLAYLSALDQVNSVSKSTASSIVKELENQRTSLKLIASENFTSLPTQFAASNLLTDNYAEGFPYHRFYAGCDNVDDIEDTAVQLAKKIFGAEHAFVQPHSGSDANLIAFWAILTTKIEAPILEEMGETHPSNLSYDQWAKVRKALGNQKLLGLNYYSGGHLTHGYRLNLSAKMFDAYTYNVNHESGLLDYDRIRVSAIEVKPLILLAGYSAYPRLINFRKMKEIADHVGAVLMVDMAHFAGLVAGGVMTGDYNPIPFADVVTTTTHKTLRGPRSGLILCKEEYKDSVDKACPLVMGGPLPHIIAAKAVALTETDTPEFKKYAHDIVDNSKILAAALQDEGLKIATGGTDNHLMLVDLGNTGINGRQGESVLRECDITCNRNALPFDKNGPWYTSGLRIGTPAITTLGMRTDEMKEIASIIAYIIKNTKPSTINKGKNEGKFSKAKYDISDKVVATAKSRVKALVGRYPVYPELDLDFLKDHYVI